MKSVALSRRACAVTSGAILLFFLLFGLLLRSDSPHLLVLVIPGGGLRDDGALPTHSALRVDRAIEIYRLTGSDNVVFITLSGGTPHKPFPRDKDGFAVLEAEAASRRLIAAGVSPAMIWEETASLDTIGNAYFLRTTHIDQIENIKKIVVVTNRWHVARTKAVFEAVFALPEHHNVAMRKKAYPLSFEAVEDGLDADALQARQAREAASLRTFTEVTQRQFSTMLALHNWLFSAHGAYAAKRHSEPRTVPDAALLKSY